MELFIASVKLCIEKCSDDISFELIPSREYTSPIEGVLVDTTFNCTFKTQSLSTSLKDIIWFQVSRQDQF